MKKRKRQDARLESEGAEFLVLGHLLVEGISCCKAYVNFPGYDLAVVNPDKSITAKVQVKSRWATDYHRGFIIKNFDCDFVVHAALNRGYRFSKRSTGGGAGVKAPDFYVLPVNVVREAQSEKSKWGKVKISNIPDYEIYLNRWRLIADFLDQETI